MGASGTLAVLRGLIGVRSGIVNAADLTAPGEVGLLGDFLGADRVVAGGNGSPIRRRER